MRSNRVAPALAWCQAHPLAIASLAGPALAALLSPGPALFWVVIACGSAIMAALVLHASTAPDDGGSVPIPSPRRPTPEEVSSSGVELTEQGLRDLTDHELCRAWRTSYVRLQRLTTHPGGTRAAVVALATQRARYLDELERRYPAGFAAWLAAGARAPSDPTRYLHHRAPSPRVE